MATSNLQIPPSSSTMEVQVIDSSALIIAPISMLLEPPIPGHEQFEAPCLSYLLTHKKSGKKVLFDLGMRPDFGAWSPLTRDFAGHLQNHCEKGVPEIIGKDLVDSITHLIWSHHHYDHTGDPSKYPSTATLVVGPGFQKEFFPGYPEREDSLILKSDYEGRQMLEIDFQDGLRLGQYRAHDFFGDGSFYLLDCPGHTIGHMMGLARTTPTTFVVLSADCCHHGGEIRPSPWASLPDYIDPSPVRDVEQRKSLSGCCLGPLYLKLHHKQSRTDPFYELKNPKNLESVKEAQRSSHKLSEFDGDENVLVLGAHDPDVPKTVDMFPSSINDWQAKGYKRKLHWAFLGDFNLPEEKK